MGKHTAADLNRLYQEAEDADREIFSEMRSNVLLVEGTHYSKRSNKFNDRVRDSKELSENQKLRLTKNHIHRISRHYKSNILTFAPGVTVLPQNERELQDQKDAELNQAVWLHFMNKYGLRARVRSWCHEFVDLGEVATKIFFDPNRGELRGYEPLIDEVTGEPVLDEMGQPQPDESKPQFKGEFVFETIFGFNLFRPRGCRSMQDAEWLGCRKMVDTKYLQKIYGGDESKAKYISESSQEEFVVFDGEKGEYSKSEGKTLLKEIYYKPCYQYPEGYFYHFTNDGILEEGPLPFGIFPIIWEGFEEFPTTPRARSIIKIARPYQAEINRAASAMAQHQITIGDDKILYQTGTKLAQGALLPGVRGITFQGMPPTVLPGRDGSQYLPYIEAQIRELYLAVGMEEESQETGAANALDPYTLLFTSMKQRKKFATYGEKFENFLRRVCELSLELAKMYMPDDEFVYAVGKSELVNLAEFRKTTKLCYQIKIEPKTDNVETTLGKQLTLTHILQYVGQNLAKDDIGKIIRNMPFGNNEESFDDLTLDYDNVKNDMLSIERGEVPPISEYENHDYAIKRLSSRMKKSDFKFLDPKIQEVYKQKMLKHQEILKEQAEKLAMAKSEFLPTGGALIATDMYVPDGDPKKMPKRARVPYQALEWLVKKLEVQGMGLEKMETMNQGVLAEMAGSMNQQQNPGPMPAGPGGQASPGEM